MDGKALVDKWEINKISQSTCSNCGNVIPGGIYPAIVHYDSCYTAKQKRGFTKKTMKALGWSNEQVDEAIKNLGI